MNRAAILEAITANKLGHLRAALGRVLQPAIRITVAKRRATDLPVGSSRIGGLPDLPPRHRWPTVDRIPLTFAGQFALNELARFKAASVLPKRGLLSFFFDGMLTGYERGEARDRARVIYTDTSSTELVRTPLPVAVPAQFRVHRDASALFETTWTLPAFEEVDGQEFPTIPPIVPILRTVKERKNYQKLRLQIGGRNIGSKLLGHADAVQGGELRFDAVIRPQKPVSIRRL